MPSSVSHDRRVAVLLLTPGRSLSAPPRLGAIAYHDHAPEAGHSGAQCPIRVFADRQHIDGRFDSHYVATTESGVWSLLLRQDLDEPSPIRVIVPLAVAEELLPSDSTFVEVNA
jgi:hypothetical protein